MERNFRTVFFVLKSRLLFNMPRVAFRKVYGNLESSVPGRQCQLTGQLEGTAEMPRSATRPFILFLNVSGALGLVVRQTRFTKRSNELR